MTTMPDVTTEVAARRYLRRWAVIGGVWLAATVLVVGWTATHRGPAVTAGDFAATAPVPITITTEPAPPLYTLPAAPEPTRYPATTTTTIAPGADTATGAHTAAIVTISTDFTSGSLTTCVNGQPPGDADHSWWCDHAPTTCVGATVWPSIAGTTADVDMQWSRSYCVSDEQNAKLIAGCRDTLNDYGGAYCVLYFTRTGDDDAISWKMAGIIDGCGGPDPIGTVISARCTRSNPVG